MEREQGTPTLVSKHTSSTNSRESSHIVVEQILVDHLWLDMWQVLRHVLLNANSYVSEEGVTLLEAPNTPPRQH